MGGKLPADPCLQVVAMALPGTYSCRHLIERIDALVETLANHHVQFNLGHIEPASMDRRVHEFKAAPKTFGLLGRKGLIERTRLMRAQVVHDEGDPLGLFVVSRDIL